MNMFEIILSIASVVAAILSICYVNWIVRTSGRDRPHDPAAVQRLIDWANRENI